MSSDAKEKAVLSSVSSGVGYRERKDDGSRLGIGRTEKKGVDKIVMPNGDPAPVMLWGGESC